MRKTRRGRRSIGLMAARGFFVAFVITLIGLIVLAWNLPKPGDQTEIREIQEGLVRDRAARAAAVAQARASMPPDAPILADWEYRQVIAAAGRGIGEPLLFLVTSFIDDPNGIPESQMARIREARGHHGRASPGSLFYCEIDFEHASEAELLAELKNFLVQSVALRQFEAALTLGLLGDIADTYRNPLDAKLVDICILLAARAACEAQDGELSRALDTLLNGYKLAALHADWQHYYGFQLRYYANRQLDRVLWRIADVALLSPADTERVLRALDARKPAEALATSLRNHAVRIELGEEGDHLGLGQTANAGFAFLGRGTLERTNQLIGLFGKPPYQVRAELERIGEHKLAGYWLNRFVDNAIQAYKLYARDAFAGDMTRLAFALMAWRREHGNYPASLGEMQPFPFPEVPKDPLTGTPVEYTPSSPGFVLSVPSDGAIWGETYWVARQ